MRNDWWIQVQSGRKFSLLDPQPESVAIEDICASLSRQARFLGHTLGKSYSVAQHSCLCSEIVEERFAGHAFAHDFAEAYTGDMPKPWKGVLVDLSGGRWKEVEDRICRVVAEKFGLFWPIPPEVKHADLVMLATEKRDLMAKEPCPWQKLPPPLSTPIEPWEEESAAGNFTKRYKELREKGLIL